MTRQDWAAYSAVAGFSSVGLGCLVALLVQPPAPVQPPVNTAAPALEVQISPAAGQSTPALVTNGQSQAAPPRPVIEEDNYYNRLRARIRWIRTSIGGDDFITPDPDSRLLLAKSAAKRAGLPALGLSFKDVYGIINAETSWVPRAGASKDGTPNLGIAQFEPATARALGLRNPDDPVEAVHAAALHIKEAAIWSSERIAGLKINADQRAEKLREGISIYYNLSTRGRNAWNGLNTSKLPRETRLHIMNARIGAQQAEFFDAQMQAAKYTHDGNGEAVVISGLPRGI